MPVNAAVSFHMEAGRVSFFCSDTRDPLVKSRRFLTVIEGTMLHFGKGNVPEAIPYPPA